MLDLKKNIKERDSAEGGRGKEGEGGRGKEGEERREREMHEAKTFLKQNTLTSEVCEKPEEKIYFLSKIHFF
jgi:hypothetical protein